MVTYLILLFCKKANTPLLQSPFCVHQNVQIASDFRFFFSSQWLFTLVHWLKWLVHFLEYSQKVNGWGKLSFVIGDWSRRFERKCGGGPCRMRKIVGMRAGIVWGGAMVDVDFCLISDASIMRWGMYNFVWIDGGWCCLITGQM